jgi:coproporphyrinogen III oxidase-like Fe-S oxidoreductase
MSLPEAMIIFEYWKKHPEAIYGIGAFSAGAVENKKYATKQDCEDLVRMVGHA